MAGALDGLRVLDIATLFSGPALAAMLGDLGADVIKVEPPNGDPQRGLKNMLNMAAGGPNPFNEVPNRGKRSITLDLKTEAGREALLEIAKIGLGERPMHEREIVHEQRTRLIDPAKR